MRSSCSLPFPVCPPAALCLGCVAGQLHAINGEHLSSNESLLVADEQHLAEDVRDLFTQCADEVGEDGEVWCGAARDRDQGDVFAAGALDVAAADDALAVSKRTK